MESFVPVPVAAQASSLNVVRSSFSWLFRSLSGSGTTRGGLVINGCTDNFYRDGRRVHGFGNKSYGRMMAGSQDGYAIGI
ncbi:hypothetical protein GCM10007868_29330 [Gluconobacter frateurii]|uniref:Uncharacterized protein n=1 Tax=Gluconobacter frateurii NRIC 0228 TaxID=1307946 RepID=A0ABQ0Q978_9PROT|nr:hypothetical protein AA0228_0778 [Gluconobacter frateurii NRIC 0228]GLP91858.1 hypothetical protein GCM10007868_29330 [Gluconobacter frateurii]